MLIIPRTYQDLQGVDCGYFLLLSTHQEDQCERNVNVVWNQARNVDLSLKRIVIDFVGI